MMLNYWFGDNDMPTSHWEEKKKKKKKGKLYSEYYWREQPPFTCRFDTPTQLHHFVGYGRGYFIDTVTSILEVKFHMPLVPSVLLKTKMCTLARITSREKNKQRGKQS